MDLKDLLGESSIPDPSNCAAIGCPKQTTYYRPLCIDHWRKFDRFQIFECEKCHWFDELVGELSEDDLCPDCVQGREKPIHAHGPVEHQLRYLYILKLDNGSYYVGQTNDLEHRLKEHRDALTMSTAGKEPKLVWFEEWLGNRRELNAEESRLTKLALTHPYVIRRMITEWQRPLRLVDLSA